MTKLFLIFALSLIFFPSTALAHVVVKPSEVGLGKFQTFTVGVPNEKENPTIEIRLIIPKGLEDVSPNVKPGWNIEVKKAGVSMKGEVLNTGEKAPDPETVTEIIWTGGSIPEGQRDDFLFSAKVPSSETTLKWMAYQTYLDGTVVSWDKDGESHNEDEASSSAGPLSQTKIINDLKVEDEKEKLVPQDTKENLTLSLAVLAIIIALASFIIELKKR